MGTWDMNYSQRSTGYKEATLAAILSSLDKHLLSTYCMPAWGCNQEPGETRCLRESLPSLNTCTWDLQDGGEGGQLPFLGLGWLTVEGE